MSEIIKTPKFVYPALFIIAVLNIFFALNLYIAGDLRFHFVLINCYADQFWQGNLYPRWCFNGNAGLGTLQPLLYFPLPYFISSLFYPLTHHGFTMAELFFLMCLLATFITAIGCYQWLKDFSTSWQALLITVFFVFLPYRMELLAYRVAYPELWFVALLPFILKYTRRMAQEKCFANVAYLAFFMALALLSHALCTLNAILFCGVYLLWVSGLKWSPKIYYSISVFWGFCIAGFYLMPAIYYQQFMSSQGGKAWADIALNMDHICKGQTMPVLARFMMAVWFAVFAFNVLVERERINDISIRREVLAWGSLGLLAAFLFSSYSEFLYAWLSPYSAKVFPWRLQIMMDVVTIYLVAIWAGYIFKPVYRHLWKLGYSGALLAMLLINVKLGDVEFQEAIIGSKIVNSYAVMVPEYKTKWTKPVYWDFANIFEQYEKRDIIPKASITKGIGEVSLKRWNWDGIEVVSKSQQPITIKFNHYYFPIWKAEIDKRSSEIRPENDTGHILLDVPAGEHTILLTYSVFNGNPNLVFSYWASLLAFIGVLVVVLSRRREEEKPA